MTASTNSTASAESNAKSARSLNDFVEDVSGQSHLRIEQDFGDGFVRLHTSEAQKRQAAQDIRCSEDILLELLRNAKDAHGRHIFVALNREGNDRTFTVIDDGDGIPEAMQELVFEPRVTSKLDTSHKDAWGFHGRGMALYSIRLNAKEAKVAASAPGQGSSIKVVTDTKKLTEKTDQSSFPTFSKKENGEVAIRGPKNLLRGACEFAIESRNSSEIYIGSPAEIACALYNFGRDNLSPIDRAFCQNPAELPLTKRLATASDPAEFASLAAAMGLSLSERTARRIMDDQINGAPEMLSCIAIQESGGDAAGTPSVPFNLSGHLGTGKSGSGAKALTQGRKVSLQPKEKAALAKAASKAFEPIADSYYLNSKVEPTVTVKGESIHISIPLVAQD